MRSGFSHEKMFDVWTRLTCGVIVKDRRHFHTQQNVQYVPRFPCKKRSDNALQKRELRKRIRGLRKETAEQQQTHSSSCREASAEQGQAKRKKRSNNSSHQTRSDSNASGSETVESDSSSSSSLSLVPPAARRREPGPWRLEPSALLAISLFGCRRNGESRASTRIATIKGSNANVNNRVSSTAAKGALDQQTQTTTTTQQPWHAHKQPSLN